jgi:hypothetical protein
VTAPPAIASRTIAPDHGNLRAVDPRPPRHLAVLAAAALCSAAIAARAQTPPSSTAPAPAPPPPGAAPAEPFPGLTPTYPNPSLDPSINPRAKPTTVSRPDPGTPSGARPGASAEPYPYPYPSQYPYPYPYPYSNPYPPAPLVFTPSELPPRDESQLDRPIEESSTARKYKLARRLKLAGGATGGSLWGASVLVGAIGASIVDSFCYRAGRCGAEKGLVLLIPVAGPFIAMPVLSGGNGALIALLAVDGIGQAVGLSLLIAGAALDPTPASKSAAPSKGGVSLSLEPAVLWQGAGLGLKGVF